MNKDNVSKSVMEKVTSPASKLLGTSTILASHQDIEGSNWVLGWVENITDDWLQTNIQLLLGCSEHSNIFFHPQFLNVSSKTIARHKVRFLFLVEQYAENVELRFFSPVTHEYAGLFGGRYLRIWSNEFAPLGQPLIAKTDIGRIVDELLVCFKNTDPKLAKGILFNSLPKTTQFWNYLSDPQNNFKNIDRFNHFERACLNPVRSAEYERMHISGKRRQRLNAARRKLNELGEITFECTNEPDLIEASLAEFMYIEGRGWKGRNNSALISKPSTHAFVIGGVPKLAAQNACEIMSLKLDGTTISSAIIFKQNGYYFPWKITFDETYSRFSPGILLNVHFTEELIRRKDFQLLDSLAFGENDTANWLWPEALPLCSTVIGFGSDAVKNARSIALNTSLPLRSKNWLKLVIKRLKSSLAR